MSTKAAHIAGIVALIIALVIIATSALAASKKRQPSGDHPIPELTQDLLESEDNIAVGKEIWADQCAHCHGAKAYPGKAPKLKPRRYSPEFVYERVNYGFRKMPPWEDVYTQDEIKSVTAWIMSPKFSP